MRRGLRIGLGAVAIACAVAVVYLFTRPNPGPRQTLQRSLGSHAASFLHEEIHMQTGQLAIFYLVNGVPGFSMLQPRSGGWLVLGTSGYTAQGSCPFGAFDARGAEYVGGHYTGADVPHTVEFTAEHRFPNGLSETVAVYAPVNKDGYFAVRLPLYANYGPTTVKEFGAVTRTVTC